MSVVTGFKICHKLTRYKNKYVLICQKMTGFIWFMSEIDIHL